jgi:hypothetical protein
MLSLLENVWIFSHFVRMKYLPIPLLWHKEAAGLKIPVDTSGKRRTWRGHAIASLAKKNPLCNDVIETGRLILFSISNHVDFCNLWSALDRTKLLFREISRIIDSRTHRKNSLEILEVIACVRVKQNERNFIYAKFMSRNFCCIRFHIKMQFVPHDDAKWVETKWVSAENTRLATDKITLVWLQP